MDDVIVESSITTSSTKNGKCRGGAANFGFISISYHQYIFGLYKYILRLEISIFDRENAKNHPKFRMIMCFWDIQSGGGISTNVGYREIFSISNILISPIDILIVSYDVKTCWLKVHIFPKGPPFGYFWTETLFISIFW